MCGIAGFIAKQGKVLPNTLIGEMTDLIHYRGPDDEGFLLVSKDHKIQTAGGESTPEEVWRTSTAYGPEFKRESIGNGQSSIAFGHKRLSILDLSPAGHQPMSYEKDRIWIVFNGEIYNYQEIKHELELSGFHFSTETDTEVILAAYSKWGEACLDRFVGMWALALYDRDRKELFLARDRYGIKPLYYYFSPEGDFYFASEIKQFTVIAGWQSRMNQNRVYDQLLHSFTDHTDETMFDGVFQLPGGTSYKSPTRDLKPNPSGKLNYRKWYTLNRDPFHGSFEEASVTFRTLFERAIMEHHHADVPVGTALSGGLDSSATVCEVNRIMGAQQEVGLQKTFSSCSVDERFSERKWMDIVVDHTNVDAHFIYPEMEEALALTPDILWHHDEPYQSQSAFLAYSVFKLARANNVIVLLNGQGADEYLGGYGQFTISRYASMTKRLKFLELLADIKKLQEIRPVSKSSLFMEVAGHVLPRSVRRRLSNIKSSSDHVKSIIDANRLCTDPIHPFDSIPVPYGTVPEISEHLTFYSTLPKYLHWEDRNSMAHSVEARVPFLDHRLVEFAYSLPDSFHEKEGINKRVMRNALSSLLPEKIMNRKDKMGFTTPEELWVREKSPSVFRKKIIEAILVSDGIIKPDALDYFDRMVAGKMPFDYTYWRLILFSEWVKKFQVKLD